MMMVIASGITAEVLTPHAGGSVMPRGVRRTGLLDCLIVSGSASRRSRFAAAAELAGWTECSVPETATDVGHAIDGDYQLVIVDIATPIGERVNDTVEIAEEFAARPGTLLVICGSEDNVDEELWARQLGAWLYLPGVTDGDSLTSLCVEARRLREGAAFAGVR